MDEALYKDDRQEIYDAHVLEGKHLPNILNLPISEQYRAMLTPHGAQWTEPNNKKTNQTKPQEGNTS